MDFDKFLSSFCSDYRELVVIFAVCLPVSFTDLWLLVPAFHHHAFELQVTFTVCAAFFRAFIGFFLSNLLIFLLGIEGAPKLFLAITPPFAIGLVGFFVYIGFPWSKYIFIIGPYLAVFAFPLIRAAIGYYNRREGNQRKR